MIEKKSEVSYGSLMKDLKARNFSPIYILEGDESFYIDKISNLWYKIVERRGKINEEKNIDNSNYNSSNCRNWGIFLL